MAEGEKKKRRWIKGAINPAHKGEFKAKAEHAGETTREFASEHEHDGGKTGDQARLAENLMNMHKAKRKAHSGKHMIGKMYGKRYAEK